MVECGLRSGCDLSGPTSSPTGQLQDGTSVRTRASVNGADQGADDNGTDISPTFDSDGIVEGRIEFKPSGETAWTTIMGNGWGDEDALVACREIGNELGYTTVSGVEVNIDETPDGSGEQRWYNVRCSGREETLESCSGEEDFPNGSNHYYDIGITCKFQFVQCEACPTGMFSNSVDTSPCTDCEAGKYR